MTEPPAQMPAASAAQLVARPAVQLDEAPTGAGLFCLAATLIVMSIAASASYSHAQPRWQRTPRPGSYTPWALPAAGASQSGDPEIILTFDDGPHETHTARILDELARRDIKAVFFWVGWRVTKPSPRRAARKALVARAIREGHVVANHTVNHEHLCKLRRSQAAQEIDDAEAVYRELTGMPIKLFRAPYGDHCRRLIDLLAERRIEHLHWDIDPMEWKDNDGKRVAGTLRRWINKTARKNRRSVILMHDTRKASTVALPAMLTWLDRKNASRRRQGLRPIRILDGSDIAGEILDPELADWLGSSADRAATRLLHGLSQLVP